MPLINVRQRKRELRAKYRRTRQSMTSQLKSELDSRLTEQILSLDEYKSCQTLFAFVSGEIECDTSAVISDALKNGKRVAVPRCGEVRGEMDFYYIDSLSCLSKGKFGILEPNPEKCEKVSDYSSGLCLVPGLCFDYQGYRIGFGGGYYDRFLQSFGGTTAGICYYKCIQNPLPKGVYDRPVDILVTERFVNRNPVKE